MSEDTSLTDAVKQAVGVSLTEAVQSSAGRRAWVVDVALETLEDAARGGRRLRRLLVGCAQLAAIATLSVIVLFAGSTGTGSDRDRPAPCRRSASPWSSAIPPIATRRGSKTLRNDASDIGAALTRARLSGHRGLRSRQGRVRARPSATSPPPCTAPRRPCSSTPGTDCWYRARTISCPSMRN